MPGGTIIARGHMPMLVSIDLYRMRRNSPGQRAVGISDLDRTCNDF